MSPRSPASLTVGVVVYHSDLPLLARTLRALAAAVDLARAEGELDSVAVTIVDNGSADAAALDATVRASLPPGGGLESGILRGHGNVGYGRGHNLALEGSGADYHLILNPDAIVEPGALAEALRFLAANPDVGMLTPEVRGAEGERQYRCRRYPSVLVLFLRGFAPDWIKRPFRHLLDRYELRDRMDADVIGDIPLASGCFMFARRG